jgi:hypothetical protein
VKWSAWMDLNHRSLLLPRQAGTTRLPYTLI